MKHRSEKKRPLRAILLALAGILAAFLLYSIGKVLFYGRGHGDRQSPARVELTWEEAAADGTVSPEEIAVHYAPEIHAAVNVLISESGKGDFITRLDFDDDLSAVNNWENLSAFPLRAAVYWSVQETDTHYFVGYYLYHPRDDAEVWLDKHENDFEGIMLAIPRSAEGFLPPLCMYTQGHGGVPFYGDGITMTEGSRRGGSLALDGHRPIIYITPNGTLDNAGHSVESAAGHSLYWSVGDSGIRYYHGGEAQEPLSFKGKYEDNPCSYQLLSLKELWRYRNGPYGEGYPFGEYGAFHGDNYRANAANPAWAWRNKTVYGFGGSFLSDPAWTFSRAVEEYAFSSAYQENEFADWKITVRSVQCSQKFFSLQLWRDTWRLDTPEWWHLTENGGDQYTVEIGGEGRQSLWVAAPQNASWRCVAVDANGNGLTDAVIDWEAEFLNREP